MQRYVLCAGLGVGLFVGLSLSTPTRSAPFGVELGGATALADEPCLESGDPLGELGQRKGVQKRNFLKRLRAELSVFGGFYAADLYSTSYNYGGAVTFWPFEDFGVEASVLVSPVTLSIEKPLTQFFTGRVVSPSLAYVVVGDLVWSPIHLKMRVSEKGIIHGDVMLFVGGGETINDSAQGATFDVGLGLKLYPTRYLAIRLDLRDYVQVQEAVAVEKTTNNLVGMVGLSLFIPGPHPITPPTPTTSSQSGKKQ